MGIVCICLFSFYGVIPCKREFRLGYWPLKVDAEGHCRTLFLCLGGLVWGPALETRGALVLFVFQRVQIWEGHLSSHAGGGRACQAFLCFSAEPVVLRISLLSVFLFAFLCFFSLLFPLSCSEWGMCSSEQECYQPVGLRVWVWLSGLQARFSCLCLSTSLGEIWRQR